MFFINLCNVLCTCKKAKIISKIFSFYLSCIIILIPFTSMAKTMVVCVGNSITERGGECGYVTLITARLGDEYDVRNFGISGRTMLKKGDRPYWKEKYFKELFKLKPDIITLMLGTNDAKGGNWSRHGKEFKADAQAMVDTLLSISSKPRIFIALPPHSFNRGYSDDVISNQEVPILRSIAEKTGVEVIDANTPMNSPAYFGDGIHPNAEGYKVLADVYYNSITSKPTELEMQPHLSKSNLQFFHITNIGVLKLSNLPGNGFTYTINTSEQMKSGISKEKIFLLNGKLISEY